MEEIKIQHRELLGKLHSIKRQSQILGACEKLGFRITNGGKHPFVVRDPENLDNGSYLSSVTTVPSHLNKQINEKIFKQILNSPVSKRMRITEEDIWKSFGIM